MTLTSAILFRLWEREADLNRIAEACRVVTACPIPGHAGAALEEAADRLIARATAWTRIAAQATRMATADTTNDADRLGEMARYPQRYTVDELLEVRSSIVASARWCRSHGRDCSPTPLRSVALAA
jgi:hypothetical protein